VKITAEELRKVYGKAVHAAHGTQGLHSTGLLAVARYVAERQRDQDATEEMLRAAVKCAEGEAVYKVMTADGLDRLEQAAFDQYRALQFAAPLVVG